MRLDERTSIPLFAVMATIPFIVAFIGWMASVSSDATEAKAQVTGVREMLMDVRERVIRIEEHVNLNKGRGK